MAEAQEKRKFKKRWSRQDFHVPGCPQGVKIPDSSNGALEKGLRYLKRQMRDSDIIGRFKSKQEYIKPSRKRRIELDEAKRSQRWSRLMHEKNTGKYVWTAVLDGEAQ